MGNRNSKKLYDHHHHGEEQPHHVEITSNKNTSHSSPPKVNHNSQLLALQSFRTNAETVIIDESEHSLDIPSLSLAMTSDPNHGANHPSDLNVMIDHHVITSRTTLTTNRDNTTHLPNLKSLQTPTPHIESPSDAYWMFALSGLTSGVNNNLNNNNNNLNNNKWSSGTMNHGSIGNGNRTSIRENSELDMNTIESSVLSSSLNTKSFVLDEYIAGLTFDVINSTSPYLTNSPSTTSTTNTSSQDTSKKRSSENSIIREAVKLSKNKRNSTSIVTLSSPTMHHCGDTLNAAANSFCGISTSSSTNQKNKQRLSSPQSLFILQHQDDAFHSTSSQTHSFMNPSSPTSLQNDFKKSGSNRFQLIKSPQDNTAVSTTTTTATTTLTLPKHLEEIPFDFSNPLMTPRHERKNSLGLALSVDTSISHVKQLFHDDLTNEVNVTSSKSSLNVQSSKDLNDPSSSSLMDLTFEEFAKQFKNNLLLQETASPNVVPPLTIGNRKSSLKGLNSVSSARSPSTTHNASQQQVRNKRNSLNALKRRTITGGADLFKSVFGFNNELAGVDQNGGKKTSKNWVAEDVSAWINNSQFTSAAVTHHVNRKSDDVHMHHGSDTLEDGEVKMKYWDEIDEEETNRKRQSFREFSQNLDLCYSIDVVRPRNRNSTSQMSNVKRLSLTLSSILSNGCSSTSPQDAFEQATADMSTFTTSPQACSITLSSVAISPPSTSSQPMSIVTPTSTTLLNHSVTSISSFPNPSVSTMTGSLQDSPQSTSSSKIQTPNNSSRRSFYNNRIRNAHNRRSLSFPTEKLKSLFKKLKE
ncbi:hypothetical protein FDP41_013726 [Naegleria fowleri]|uniref:Uncharacterized protein n=1 Tax=Naegleria fowleri TaxID=5763 RepID=A0A6A5C143_NAEFO|nr:uncharacterized protein FDP41_013726 [Naegleria fowleri]KAF0980512.1 hypothetical protein FDP41_013726 [Naegleria fowleri]